MACKVANGVQRVALHWASDKLPFSSASVEKQNFNQCHQMININTRYSFIIPINAKNKIRYLKITLTTPLGSGQDIIKQGNTDYCLWE